MLTKKKIGLKLTFKMKDVNEWKLFGRFTEKKNLPISKRYRPEFNVVFRWFLVATASRLC